MIPGGGGGGGGGGGDLDMDETLTEFHESIDYCSTRRQPVVQKENRCGKLTAQEKRVVERREKT